MQSHANRNRLVLPVAAIVALGSVSVPHTRASVSPPRLTEVAAVRLQAEVTSLVSGVAGAIAPIAPAAAAAVSPAAGSTPTSTPTYNPNYTWLDNFVANLPDKIRYAILPPLYVVAAALGAVIGIVKLLVTPIVRLFNPESTFPFPSAAVATPAVRAQTRPTRARPVAPPSSAPGDIAGSGKSGRRVARPVAEVTAKVAGAVATARSRARARIAAAAPSVPAAAAGTDASPLTRTPRAARSKATVSADAAPASRRAKRSVR